MPGPNIELFGRDLRELDDFENLSPGGLTGDEILALFSPEGAAGRRIIGKISTQRLADLTLAIGVFTALSVADEAYGSGWNASLEVPTKNAIYDKIEALIAAIAANYQLLDSDLTAFAALSPTNDDIVQRKAGAWTNRSIAQLLTDLGLAALYQPLDSDLTAIAALTTTSFGRAFLALADASATRTAIGLVLGTDIYSKAAVDAGFQPLDSDLTAIAALSTTSFGRSVLAAANAAALATLAGVGAGDSPTMTALTLTNGQIVFPASQVASAGANTLDDYEEGTFTPSFTFATPGTLSITWSSLLTGLYTKIGRKVSCQFELVSSAYTLGTGSGLASITGLPFTSGNNSNSQSIGSLDFGGITKANYTQFVPSIGASATTAGIVGCAQAQSAASLTAAEFPTGGTIRLIGSVTYFA